MVCVNADKSIIGAHIVTNANIIPKHVSTSLLCVRYSVYTVPCCHLEYSSCFSSQRAGIDLPDLSQYFNSVLFMDHCRHTQ